MTLDGTTTLPAASISGWSDTSFTLTIPASVAPGQHRLAIVNTASAPDTQSINGLALHVLGTGYRPSVIEVGPDMWTLIGSPTNLRFRLGTNGTQTPVITAAPGGFTAAQLQTAISAPARALAAPSPSPRPAAATSASRSPAATRPRC